MLKLGDGAHLHLEATKQKEKKGEPKLPLCQDLVMAPTCAQKKKTQKKEEEGELKFPFCQDLAICPRSNKLNE